MGWISAISQLIGTLAWPTVVFALALLFRHQLRGVLERLKKIDYPGGSITMQDVARFERAAADAGELPSTPATVDKAHLISDYTTVVLGKLHTDVERELFQIAQVTSHGAAVQFVSLPSTLRELRDGNSIPSQLAMAIEEFADIYNRSVSDSRIPNEIKERVAIIATGLSIQLHRQRLIVEMEYEFDSNGLWHMHSDAEGPAGHYYWWAAVADSCPQFEYDYDIYRIAAERHNNRLIRQMGQADAKRGLIAIISSGLHRGVAFPGVGVAPRTRSVQDWPRCILKSQPLEVA